jgi:uncharacterized protein (UPF0212 family)
MACDFFKIGVKCPVCEKESSMTFETQAVGKLMNEFKFNDRVSQNDLCMWDCEIENARTNCPKCHANLKGSIIIKNQKFIDVSFIVVEGLKT